MAAPETITLATDRDPWARQPGETPKRHAQFMTYASLPGLTRDFATAAEALGLTEVHVRQVAGAYHWRDRAAARDADKHTKTHLGTIDDMIVAARDDAKVLLVLRAKVAQHVRNLDLTDWTPEQFLRLLEIMLRQGRTLFGGAGDLLATLAAGGQGGGEGGDPFAAEVEAWSAMGPNARAEQMRHLTRQAEARLAAMSGMDDP